MPIAIVYLIGTAIVGVGAGYSLNKLEDVSKLALIGGGVYLAAKLIKVI
jgi:hypothetical protein